MLRHIFAFLMKKGKGADPSQAISQPSLRHPFPEGSKVLDQEPRTDTFRGPTELGPQPALFGQKASGQDIPASGVQIPGVRQIKDGRCVVKYLGERIQSESVLISFEIICGPEKGAVVLLALDNRLAKRAIKERKGGWTEWMAFEGDQKCSDLEHARSQAHEGHFMITVKDGTVQSILDPNTTWEQVEQQILRGGGSPIGGFQREGWENLVELALQHRVPLDLEFGPKPERYEAMIPQGWEAGNLILKKVGGRKIITVRRDGIGSLQVSECDQGAWEFPQSMDTFVLALVRHPSEELKLQALSLLEFLGVSPEEPTTWAFLVEMAKSSSPKVRGRIADGCRSWTVRERKTVLGTSYSMLVSIPAVFDLLWDLASNPDAEVRMKACYALGDHPGTQAGTILEALARGDSSMEVRRAATHGLERLREFEKVRSDYEVARAEKVAKSTRVSQKAAVS